MHLLNLLAEYMHAKTLIFFVFFAFRLIPLHLQTLMFRIFQMKRMKHLFWRQFKEETI